jgi:tetratricopeptide (TPR) repeat protein
MIEDEVPDPADAGDLAEFIAALDRLRLWAGGPSYRTLAKRVGPLLRPPQTVAHTTVSGIFQPQRRRLDLDLVTATVRALGLSEADTARWRQACVRVHAEAKSGGPGAVLRQLPADLASFTGRERELGLLMEHAEAARTTTVVISGIVGMGGVGKTRLAVRAAHELVRAGRFADVQLFANLRGFDPEQPPAAPAAVLDSFLRALGVPGQKVPASLDERAAMYRDQLHGRSALVVLDNAADAEQVRELIPAGPNCLTLVTSRRTLAELDGTVLMLDTFSVAEAVELLATIAGRDRVAAEPGAAEQVAELCGRLPLAVALAAARLRSRPTWRVADLARRLAESGVDAVSAGEDSLRRVFNLSHGGLSEPAGRLFALLGLHPGADFSCEAVAALAGVELSQARETLELLLDEHLVEQRAADRYSLHDLLRDYAAGLAGQRHDAEEAVCRLLMFHLDTADRADRQLLLVPQPIERVLPEGCRPLDFEGRAPALAWFEAEYRNLLAVLELAAARGRHKVATELPVMMGQYFVLRADSGEWIAALRIAVDSATKLGDPARLGGALNRLGNALSEGGRNEEAAEALTRAVEVGRTLEGGLLLAVARGNLATVRGRLGHVEEAVGLLTETLQDHRRMGNRISEGVTLENLGQLSLQLGDHGAAIEYCEQAIAVYRETDRVYELVSALNVIGQVHHERGDLTAAEATYRQALAIGATLGTSRDGAHTLHLLGLTLRAAGDEPAAAEQLRRALDAYTDLGDPRAAEVARALTA